MPVEVKCNVLGSKERGSLGEPVKEKVEPTPVEGAETPELQVALTLLGYGKFDDEDEREGIRQILMNAVLAEKHKTLLETIDKLKDGKRNTFNCPEWHNPIADTALEIVKCQAQKIKALEKTINDK